MVRIEHSIEIQAPVEKVWKITLNVEDWARLMPNNFTRIAWQTPPPVIVGSQATIKQPAQSEKTWTVTKIEQEKCFAWTTNLMGMSMTAEHLMSPTTSGGTNNTLAIELQGGTWASIVGAIVRAPFHKALSIENSIIKAEAERRP